MAAPKKLNDAQAAVYKDAVDNIRFAKQQQWKVTNYAALIYGLVAYLGTKEPLFDSCEGKAVLTVGALAVCAFSLYLLGNLQNSIHSKFRERVSWVYKNCFTAEESRGLVLPRKRSWLDAICAGLMLVSLTGAALALTLVWTN